MSGQFRGASEAEKLRWFGHIVRRDEKVEIKSVGVENRRTEKERQASETMD